MALMQVFRVPNCDCENASGLIPVLVFGLVEDVMFADSEAVSRQLGRHHVLDLDVVSKNWLFPIDLNRN